MFMWPSCANRIQLSAVLIAAHMSRLLTTQKRRYETTSFSIQQEKWCILDTVLVLKIEQLQTVVKHQIRIANLLSASPLSLLK